jgi:hypothetical protein
MTWDGEPEEKANVFGLHKAIQNSFSNSKTDISITFQILQTGFSRSLQQSKANAEFTVSNR